MTLFFLTRVKHKFLQQKEMGGHGHSGFAKVIDLTEFQSGGGLDAPSWGGVGGLPG